MSDWDTFKTSFAQQCVNAETAMSEIKDGGHAFPVLQYTQNGYVVLASGGMTLRDWFAGKALSGMLSYPGDERRGSYHNNSTPDLIAVDAYGLADAMLRARSQS
jgi:hypothetical protein